MDDEDQRYELTDRAAAMAEGLDMVLAMLLLTKRVHVENISLAGKGLAQAQISGEMVENGLHSLAQVMTLIPQADKRGKKRKAEDDEEDEDDAPAKPSFWQALKDFALPPMAQPATKRKK